MLAARLTIVQVLDHFQASVQITEFQAGSEPVQWTQGALTFSIDEFPASEDSLSTVIELIRLWSERTITN